MLLYLLLDLHQKDLSFCSLDYDSSATVAYDADESHVSEYSDAPNTGNEQSTEEQWRNAVLGSSTPPYVSPGGKPKHKMGNSIMFK